MNIETFGDLQSGDFVYFPSGHWLVIFIKQLKDDWLEITWLNYNGICHKSEHNIYRSLSLSADYHIRSKTK